MTNKNLKQKTSCKYYDEQTIGSNMPKIRLTWYSNEVNHVISIFFHLKKKVFLKEIYAILNNYSSETSLTNQVQIRPSNGSLFLFDRNIVKNFKKDLYTWKRRKDGGNSVREDRMSLKINGVDCIYGCYSHNSFIQTFHRRCYWLLAKPNIVLVHYLLKTSQQQQECNVDIDTEDNLICDINIGLSLNANLKQEDYLNELISILWPYTLNQNNQTLIEHLVTILFQTNQLKKCLKLTNFNQFIQKFSTQSLEINFDIPLIQLVSDQKCLPKIALSTDDDDDDDIYLSKTSITLNEEEVIIYIIVKNELKYKLNGNLKYYIQLLSKLFELKFVNTTLLELKLDTKEIISNVQINTTNTHLYFYDSNFNLIYKPFNFEICVKKDEQITTPALSFIDKYRLLILEKLLFIYNLFKLNLKIDFNLEFEQRLVSLVDYLTIFIQQQQIFEMVNNNNNDENKNLFHLSILCNYKYLFNSLLALLRAYVYSGNQYQVLSDELNLNKCDCFSLKPVDYAKKYNYFEFIEKINDFDTNGQQQAITETNEEFILNDDLSWLNEINDHNTEFPLNDDHFKSPTEPLSTQKLLKNIDNATAPAPYIDDQDKKIKTLADNIIAAMPMKIKSNSYSFVSTSVTQTSAIDTTTVLTSSSNVTTIPSEVVHQHSFDLNDFRQSSVTSTNDDASPLGSISSQNQSPTASNFHIDSPPSTAEFSKYFHAKKTYKSFENDFSQLTLTDDEQRELYEAALIIQNAYRRYLKRKRTRYDTSTKMIKTATTSQQQQTSIAVCCTSSSLNINNKPIIIDELLHVDDEDDEVCTKRDSEDENQNVDAKQYEAACIIQKYFRRYKQVTEIKIFI